MGREIREIPDVFNCQLNKGRAQHLGVGGQRAGSYLGLLLPDIVGQRPFQAAGARRFKVSVEFERLRR